MPNRAIAVLVMGVVLLVCFGVLALKGQATSGWPSVEGTIIESYLEKTRRAGGRAGVPSQIVWRPTFKYEYEVQGNKHIGERRAIHPDEDYKRQSAAQHVADQYPVGARVRVYYDPANPSEAVLEVGATSKVKTLLILPCILIVVSSGILFVSYRRKRAIRLQREQFDRRRTERQKPTPRRPTADQ